MKIYGLLCTALVMASCASDSERVISPVTQQNGSEQAVTPPKKPEIKPTPTAQQPVKPIPKPGEITGIEITQLFTMLQSGKVHLIDVRPPLFYRLGHIDTAVNFPLIKYERQITQQRPVIQQAIASGKTVVLYCQNVNCPDAYKTALKLVKHGHNVSIYKGGWEEWKKSGLQ